MYITFGKVRITASSPLYNYKDPKKSHTLKKHRHLQVSYRRLRL